MSEINQFIKRKILPRRSNSRIKRLVNEWLGVKLFNVKDFYPATAQLHQDYVQYFGRGNEVGKRIFEDLADQSGFLRPNINCDQIQEGKRQMFLHMLSRITKQPNHDVWGDEPEEE